MSTDDQVSSGTPENQRHALQQLAETRGLECAGSFEDLGVSGTIQLVERPAWARLLPLLAPGDEIHCHDVTRLTRLDGLEDAAHLLRLVRDRGVILVTVLDGEIRLETPTDVVILVIKTTGAAEERLRSLIRLEDGKLRKLREGKPGAGCRPAGILYTPTSGWSLCPDWTRTITSIFKRCAAGEPLWRIAAELDADGVKPPKGVRWNVSTIQRLLRNPAYRGEMIQRQDGETFTLHPPAMIDEALWAAAQAGLSARHNVPLRRREAGTALCRGKLFCGVCGRRMRTKVAPEPTDPPGKVIYTRYHCRSGCKGGSHRAGAIDPQVWGLLSGAIRERDALLASALPTAPGRDDEAANLLFDAEKQIARIAKDRRELMAQHAAGRVRAADYYATLSAFAAQEKADTARLQRARRVLADAALARGQRATVAEQIEVLRGKIEGADFSSRRDILGAVVPDGIGKIVVFPDRRIEFHGVLGVEFSEAKASPDSATQGGFHHELIFRLDGEYLPLAAK